ncbi:SDR family NAD(P)-dependent oxidoreductase [Kitasatospora sp. NPDC057223]|uniref:SDR family NAD(P)-dependent oxidoreductase n=1 Tax=Kitasatospora sp. NPDC057223 TaxID=3346055 RepID=UPI0036458CE6
MEETSTSDGTRQTPLTRALATVRTLRRQLDEQQGSQPIAVVGVGLRLPGGIDDLDGYWDALAAGRDLVRPMPPERRGPFAAEWEGLPQRGGFLDEVLDFDAAFFGISPREARHLDPQHRLLLEVSWEALENAALPVDGLAAARTGLFLGIMWQDYREWLAGEPEASWTTGNGHNFAAGRVAYHLGLTGPAVSVDTACSSSLVAVHLAAQALRRGECEIALAAGTNLIMSPNSMRLVRETRSLAPDGLCKSFDARANGFTRGEGCGVVVLKRLDHARRDGDRVHAVIHGSAVNQDGRSGGFTAPNVLSQVAVIEQALAEARLEPADIGFVEAHGTGTSLGDPIEMEALATALGRPNGGAPLSVGAVKTNLGHLESAAGVAGLAKAVLCLRERKLPPLVHLRTLNPRIDLSGTGITLPTELTDWSPQAGRYAGVSSFGMSGTNAHVILGAPEPEADRPAVPVEGFTLSAKTPDALRTLAARYAGRALALDPADYPAFAHTATAGRTGHEHRARITAATPQAAAEALRALADGTPSPAVATGGEGAPGAVLPRRVTDLPTYPWQRQRYAPDHAAGTPPLPGAHELRWQDHTPAGPAAGATLIFAGDDTQSLEQLVREAAARGHRGTVLCPVPLSTPSDWQQQPLPAGSAGWAAFWAGRGAAGPAALVLALRAAALPPDAPGTTDPVDAGAALCAAVTTATLAATSGDHRVHAVTRGVLRTADGERTAGTDHGLLHGLAPVLGLELGAAWGGVIDLPAEPGPADAAALIALVTAADRTEDVAAVRAGALRVPRLTPSTAPPRPLTVRPDATYLVTGALGAVGRELTGELVRLGARHLLLIGRRPEPDLAAPATALLAALRAQGVRVDYRDGGCDTPAALAAACTPLSGLPPVHGVIHAAGTLQRTPAAGLTAEHFADALRGKAAGAWALHQASQSWPLDFFVLVSSVSALWGTEDCAAYSAANGALDALAAHRTALGLPAVSLAYGPWALDGDGMADAGLRSRSARLGVGALDAAAGRAALTGTAPGAAGHLVACPLDLGRLRQVTDGLRPRGLFATATASSTTAAAPAAGPAEPSVLGRLAALPERARREAAAAEVARLTAVQLGHASADDIDRDTGFFDLGLDSITAVDLAVRLGEAFEGAVQVADIFDHPTVTRLADRLLAGHVTHRPAAAPPPVVAPAPAPAGSGAPRPEPGEAEPIAIVGMAGRFPQADSVDDLWHLLREGRDGVTPVPADRWDQAALAPGRVTTDQGGFLGDLDRFDAAFFAVPAREAESLDPQQRLLLESAWHALEDSGIDPGRLRETRTGVFVGVSSADYARLLARGGADQVDAYYGTGTALNAAAGRLAFTLGLTGPALAVDTACSSSLVALHLAVRSLRSGESDAALAGGVNVLLDPMSWVAVSQAHMLAPQGRCRTFSADADGFVRSEGCGVLVLKRLSDARRDGDRVLAVIRGSAVNQDGASSGLTAPNGAAQEAMLRSALADAATDAREVSYLEAHGTGTALGDPVELGAAWRVLGEGRRPGEPLHVGSVKSNIGHCESAAGLAAVIKTVLALRHDLIPANLHFGEPNPHVPWAEMNVRVVDTPTPWRRGAAPRVAGVSGFGFTGTNAHLLLADAPEPEPGPEPAAGPAASDVHLLPLSAPDPEGLERLTAAWEQRLTAADDTGLAALAATAGAGRAHFPYRRALLGRSREQLLDALREPAPGGRAGRAPKVAFLFSGQGSQYFGMGRELYESEPVFREVFDRCDAVLTPKLGASLTELMFYGEDRNAIDETRCTQPALVTLETALAALWESWGVTPAVVMGHSVGEIAAAMHAGVMDLPTGLGLIADRARLMQATERGAMLAVLATEEQVLGWTQGLGLDLAAVNGPAATVVAGEPAAIDALAERLKEQGVRARRLAVSHAFHSRLLDPAVEGLADALAPLEFRAPQLPVISNVTGRPAGDDTYDAAYWCRHARQPVRFHDGARQLAELGVDVCLEIGPDRTLVNLVNGAGLTPAGGLAASLKRGTGERAALLGAARTLYLAGQDLDWRRVQPAAGVADAPRYPFADTRYWTKAQPPQAAAHPAAAPVGAPAWGTELRSPALPGRVWATERSTGYPAHLTDHRLFGTVSVPGASQTATALSALGADGGPVVLEDLHFPRALVLREGESYPLQVIDSGPATAPGTARTVSVQSLVDPADGRWQEHLSARIAPAAPARPEPLPEPLPDPRAFAARAERHLTGADFYGHLRSLGYHLGPSFRWIDEAWISGDEALVRYVEPEATGEDPSGYRIHPGLLDSCLQSAVTFAVPAAGEDVAEESALAIPFAIARLSSPGRPGPGRELWGHIRAARHDRSADGLMQVESADIRLYDADGAPVLVADGFRFRRAPRTLLERSLRDGPRHAYELTWQPARPAAGPARRITLLGADTPAGRALAAACTAAGHAVTPAGTRPPTDVDLLVDARFHDAPADAEAAQAAAVTLADTLRTADPGTPYALLTSADPAHAPAAEALWGLLAALEAEQPQRRLLRLALGADWNPATVAEVLAAPVGETRLRIDGSAAHAARLTPCEAAGGRPAAPGAVLITGGLGALGLSAAGFLARLGAPALTLMGRSAPDAAARAVIAELTAAGAVVRIVQGDVTDPEDCRRAVAEAGREAPLRTVLHLAGVTDDHAFEQLTPEAFERVFAAKARGAANLAAALTGHELTALLLFSSASAVLGSAGQANYAAANGFLDGLAVRLRTEGVPATAVGWGPWTPAAKAGLAGSAATGRAIARTGVQALDDQEAEELLLLALGGQRARLAAVALDPERYTEQLAGHPRGALLEALGRRRPAAPAAAPAARPRGWLGELLAGDGPESLADRLRGHVRELAGAVLGEPLGPDDHAGFSDCGLDSIMVIDLRTRLAHALARDLPATVALDHPTVAQLASHCAGLLAPTEPDPAPEEDFADLAGLSFDDLVKAVQADVAAEK